MDKIYKVTTEGDCEGRTTKLLGYAVGNIIDIKEYYQNLKTYDLRVEEITVQNITPESARKKKELIKEKEELEIRLKSINTKLR